MTNKTVFKLCLLVLCILFAGTILAQNVVIQGWVKDAETKDPMIGVSVMEKGTTNGTMTDTDGHYKLTVEGRNATLSFSYVGYKSQILSVGNRTTLNVLMEENIAQLAEVVAIGYGSTRKEDLSMAVSTVKLDHVIKSRPSNFESILQGQISGVTIQAGGGDPLSQGTISIRGRGSRGTDNNPASGDGILYVVDGVPNAPFNVEDVESITVLKDAASAAIYGASVGSGGVIIVTTKQARSGKVVVDANVSYSIKNAWRLPKTLTSEQYNQVWADATNAATGKSLPIVADPDKYPYGNVTRTDWLDEVFRTGQMQHYALSLSGGNDILKGFASVQYDKDEGIVQNTYSDRLGSKMNLDFQVAKWLKISERATFQYSNGQGDINTSSHEGVLLGAVYYPRSATVYEYDQKGNLLLDEMGNPQFGGTIPRWAVNEGIAGYGEIRNPVAALKRLRQHRPSAHLFSTTSIEIKPITQLTVRSDFSAGFRTDRFEEFRAKVPEYGNPSTKNERNISSSWNTNWLWETTATYAQVFSDKHHISAMLGFTMGKENYRWSKTYTSGYAKENPHYTVWENATNWSETRPEEVIWDESMVSVFGRAAYSYADRYFITASLRRDATSKLYHKNNSGVFPAFSGSWKISSERFFEPITEYVSLLKLRGSWGQVGNAALVPRYSYNALLGKADYDVFVGTDINTVINGTMLETIPVTNLHWETTEQTGVGLDFELFNSEITFSVDWYNKLTKDLIEFMPLSPLLGVKTEPYGNVGKVRNRGWEFALGYNKRIGEVGFNVFANLSTVKNKVLNLGGIDFMQHPMNINSLEPLRSAPGQPWYSYYVIETEGVFKSDEEVDSYRYVDPETGNSTVIQPNAKAGDFRFVDYNNDGKINEDDRQFKGNYLPELTYGFGGSVNWRGFDFSFFFQGIGDVTVFNGFKLMGLTGRQQGNNMLADVLKSYNYNPNSGYPRLPLQEDPNGNYSTLSDFWLENGSYLRLKNVTIGYTLPQSAMRSIGLKGSTIRFYMSGDNLLTITDYTGFDPEVGNFGIDGGRYPVARSYSFGLNLSF